ncbi:unnamed protein product [Effrenium voratum]|uniref:Ketosynthase family 3 (KS3) domain-containing protein n=1 Tax=Effrenium voratum TaxID=2562239 RepID=A0AA36JC21_9DINO|nr:unnamed protein product [Effrenium voratum]CAJ1448841.1 unnamed protein product [Effrenium voratum]
MPRVKPYVDCYSRDLSELTNFQRLRVGLAFPLPAPLEYLIALLGTAAARCVAMPLNVHTEYLTLRELDAALVHVQVLFCPELDGLDQHSADAVRRFTQSAERQGIPICRLSLNAGALKIRHEELDTSRWDSKTLGEEAVLLLQTSGSTGKPKAIPLTRQNVSSAVDSVIHAYGLTEQDVTYISQPMVTVGGLVTPLLSTLVSGGTVVYSKFNAAKHWEVIAKYGVTWYTAVPEMHKQIIESQNGRSRRRCEHTVRFIRNGSGCLPQAFVDALQRLFDTKVVVAYGMTEATQLVCANPLDAPKPNSVGTPAKNIRLGLFDNLSAVAPQENGEICISGSSVFEAYWGPGMEEVNHLAFFTDVQGTRWYRTGDIGWQDQDGYVFLVGRANNMMKINGYKVFPERLEQELEKKYPSLRFALVQKEESLALMVQSRKGEVEVDMASLCRQLAELCRFGVSFPLPKNAYLVAPGSSFLTKSSSKIDRKQAAALSQEPEHVTCFHVLDYALFGSECDENKPKTWWLQLAARLLQGLCGAIISPEERLQELALTSLQVMAFTNMMNVYTEALDTRLQVSQVLQAASLQELVDGFLGKGASFSLLGPARRVARSRTAGAVLKITPEEEEVVQIMGVSCRFPGHSNNLDAFVQLLLDQRCGIVERKDWHNERYPEIAHVGLIEGKELFDRTLFGISSLEASYMDTQQLAVLEGVYEAVLNSKTQVSRKDVPVVVAVSHADAEISFYSSPPNHVPPHIRAYKALSAIAGRVSQLMDLRGPSFCVDAACGSSMVALHESSRMLRSSNSKLAIATAVNHISSMNVSVSMAPSGLLSKTGRCHTWDAAADGFVRGEGSAALLLALDSVDKSSYGQLRYSLVKHNGRTSHLTFPDRKAEAELMHECMQAAGIAVGEVDYVEAHGTGTVIGDATEAQALQDVFARRALAGASPLRVGSVKANVGHLEASAGMAGIFSVLCVLRRGRVFANAELKEFNPYICDGSGGSSPALDFPIESVALNEKLVAGCNSFGFAGTIGTALLAAPSEPPIDAEPAAATSRRVAFVVSLTPLPPQPELQELAAPMDCRSFQEAMAHVAQKVPLLEEVKAVLPAILQGQAPCPTEWLLVAHLVFQFCTAAVWKAHGVHPDEVAFIGHCLPSQLRELSDFCAAELGASVRCTAPDAELIILLAESEDVHGAASGQPGAPGARVLPGAGRLWPRLGEAARLDTFALERVQTTLSAHSESKEEVKDVSFGVQIVQLDEAMVIVQDLLKEVEYGEEEFEADTVPFMFLDSLQWVTFTSLMRSRYNLTDISMDACVADLARQLAGSGRCGELKPEGATDSLQCLTSLVKEDAGNVLIGVHGIEGDPMALQFRTLSSRLSGVLAIYALKVTERHRKSCCTLEDLARMHVEALQRRFGFRSYNLYGHSFGAMVAHKMAEVLEAQNIKVTLLLGDFEVAYPPERFMASESQFTERCRMGAWEGPEMEAYKILLRRHMFSHREDAEYCEQLLRSSDVRRRENEMKGFVLTQARPSSMPMESYCTMIQDFAANMGFHEELVKNSSQPAAALPLPGFFAEHSYEPRRLGKATLFVSASPEFSCCVEVNKQYYEELQVVHEPSHEHYNLLESEEVIPQKVLEVLGFA